MEITEAIRWASGRKVATLVTLRSDGRPQSSDIVFAVDGDSFLVSVTDDRAKTANMRRDRRVVLHVSEPETGSYVSFDSTVELSPVAMAPDDATSSALATQYEMVAGEPHPDWDEFRRAMVEDKRLLVRVVPRNAVGQIH